MVVNGRVITGFATDRMITVARREDMGTNAVGVQGDVTYNENANDSGTMTVTSSGTSSSLPTLRDLALRRQQVSVLLADANDDSNVYVSGDRRRITPPHDLTRAQQPATQPVTLLLPAPDTNDLQAESCRTGPKRRTKAS